MRGPARTKVLVRARCGLRLLTLLALSPSQSGCGAIDCLVDDDCPLGAYCVLESSDFNATGRCTEDCFEATDCPAPSSPAARAICDNTGRCRVVSRIPKLRLRLPEPDAAFPEGTRTLQVSGQVETAADRVSLLITPTGSEGCPGAPPLQVRLNNESGTFQVIPFTLDRVFVEPSTRQIRVEASGNGASRQREVEVRIDCPDCAEVAIARPGVSASVPSLILPELAGRIRPPVPVALWRVRGGLGGIFDGLVPVDPGGGFSLSRLPLFGGTNQIEVLVSGVGTGQGQTRCSTFVQAAGRERGLRVVLTWDTPESDFDLHLIGPAGRFADPQTSLSARTPSPSFGGVVSDDFDGFGPEVLGLQVPPEGIYGLVVEPVIGSGSGLIRLLDGGMPLTAAPVGPRFIDADRAELWIVGTLSVQPGVMAFRALDEVLPLEAPPTRPPASWPSFR